MIRLRDDGLESLRYKLRTMSDSELIASAKPHARSACDLTMKSAGKN
jgi:hypothetical protein